MNEKITKACGVILLIIIVILLVILAISFQYLASAIIARDGFGNGQTYACTKCDALFNEVDGVCLPNHWFYLPHRHWRNVGTAECEHQWQETGSGHVDGHVNRLYFLLIRTSQVFFFCSGLIVIIGVIVLVKRKTSEPVQDMTSKAVQGSSSEDTAKKTGTGSDQHK